MVRKPTQQFTKKNIEKLLNQQTNVILKAVDEKLTKQQKFIDYRISVLEKRLGVMEVRINQKLDRLVTTLR